jgi:hypothetical protein
MKKVYISFISFVLLLCNFGVSKAVSKDILITEIQTGSEVSATEEFVEIYNNGIDSKDISGWSLYYKSATGSSWIKKATIISKVLNKGEFFVFSANMSGDITYSSTFSDLGGNIQIRDSVGLVVDQFAWGSANSPLGSAASESKPGQSMYRIYDFESAIMQNTDDNFNDFEISNTPTPSKLPELIVPEEDTEPIKYLPLELSEIFPDPAAPLSDTSDEFIEIYNPNSEDINLSGWKLVDESGSEFIIKNSVIAAGSRLAIFVVDSKITLNNTGDSIKLINPNGELVDESENYEDAKEGLGWIKYNQAWVWAVSATPNAVNAQVYVEADTSSSSAVNNVKKATKKATAKKAKSTSKPKTSKVNSSASKSNISAPLEETSKSKNSNLWTWLLVASGLGTIGYGIYEYRTEIQIRIQKLRAKFGARG